MMQRRRSVTQLTSPKEITDGASRYCLVAQEHDTDGELETKLYKVSQFMHTQNMLSVLNVIFMVIFIIMYTSNVVEFFSFFS